MAAADDLHPSLRNIVDQESLNWIFVGGKGWSKSRYAVVMDSISIAHDVNDSDLL
jgi:hypothetical protein